MPTTWTTYWGNELHGLFVTWTHDPSAAGTAQLYIKFTANRYADPIKAGLTNAQNVPTIDVGTTDNTVSTN